MRTRLVSILVVAAAVVAAMVQPLHGEGVTQDRDLLRFLARAFPYFPGSSYTVTEDTRHLTPSGSYRVVVVDRQCDSTYLAGASTALIDEVRSTVWVGSIGRLPFAEQGIAGGDLKTALDDFLPKAMETSLGMRVRLDWAHGDRQAGALIPFTMMVDTGYGEFAKQVAVTGDGAFVVLGAWYPRQEDPVTFRRELLDASPEVMWDHEPREPRVDVVEFSDLQCPGCKAKWSLIEGVLERHPASLRHGMVSFPLTKIHPWAFRASAAAWCVAAQRPLLLTSFKELFYSIQREMSVSEVTPTALDFVEAEGLQADAFNACYLKDASLDGVHRQMALGHRLGVAATPTYFVDGWMVQVPDEAWFPDFVQQLLDGDEPS